MLSNFGRGQLFLTIRRFASSGQPAAFTEWSKRNDDNMKKYPKLFSADFVKDQEKFLKKNYTKENLSKMHSEYEKSRQAIDQATGENVFMAYDLDSLIAAQPHPENSSFQTKDEALAKLTKGTDYVQQLLAAQKAKTNTIEETNLKMIKVADYADAIEHWRARLPDATNDSSELVLPISDQELDQWANREYFHAPSTVRVQKGTFEEHRNAELSWMGELDEKLVTMLKKRDKSFDEKKFRDYLATTNEIFHPFKIDHYTFSNYAKALFRSALWEGKDRLQSVEEGIKKLSSLVNNKSDNDSRIVRAMYEDYPDSKFSELAALQLEMTDPLFGARLCDEARSKLDFYSFDRAVKDVVRDVEVPFVQSDLDAAKRELATSHTNTALLEREIRILQEKLASYDANAPTLENILDEILPKRLWGKDHKQVKEAILNYASGKGKLDDIYKATSSVLVGKGTNGSLTQNEIMQFSVQYHNARYSDVSFWNFSDFMFECGRVRKEDFILSARRIVKKKLENEGCDPMVVNMVRSIIEQDETECRRLPQVVEDFEEILKQYRGEIDAVIISAQELDDKTFGQLQKALETANPDKKITTTRAVDPGLQAGFIVKAGVQRFDFSLATAIHEGRKSVGA